MEVADGMNPYTVTPRRVSCGLKDWQTLLGEPAAYEPLRCARLLLASAMLRDAPEGMAQATDDFSRACALIRRVEWQQRMGFLSRLPRSSACERVLLAVFLLTELTAAAAQAETGARARAAMDFLLPEACDMLYRTANLLSLEYGISADEVLCGQAELMPGRPCIAAHRHPYDDVLPPLRAEERTARSFVSLSLLRAAARSVANLASEALGASCEHARGLYAELSLIASAHAAQYESLLGAADSPEEELVLHAYAGCYAYEMLTQQEEDAQLRAAYQEALYAQYAHLHRARQLLLRAHGMDARVPFAQEELPAPLLLQSSKGYIRKVLRNVGVTLRRGQRLPVGTLPESADFFRYQQRMNADVLHVPSHAVVTAHIQKNGQDFRAELALSLIHI